MKLMHQTKLQFKSQQMLAYTWKSILEMTYTILIASNAEIQRGTQHWNIQPTLQSQSTLKFELTINIGNDKHTYHRKIFEITIGCQTLNLALQL